ncbi:MAG: hypothetical protein LBE38_10465 [Deltaproteobacteria bacterium]|nr:hypothetical protein [Deltaproteobacteria bacterium]
MNFKSLILNMMAMCLIVFFSLDLEAAGVEGPDKMRYQKAPFLSSASVVPHVLIVISKHIQMFQHGYPGLSDMDGDGRIDTGFNPSVEYIGYFDPRSCYAYNGSTFKGMNYEYAYGDPNGYFYRAGDTVEDDSEARIRSQRPANLPLYVVSPRSSTGICRGVKSGNQKTFSGNWLNYVTTSRMDAIRKILYGGSRIVDTTTETFLIGSYVPPDSTVWGTEVRSDDTWAEITPLNAYYDLTKYTPFEKPLSKKAHFFGRGSDLSASNRFPALRVLKNADISSFDLPNGKDGVGEKINTTPPYGRYWDWVLVNRPLPDDMVLKRSVAQKNIVIYQIKVKVCDKKNMSLGENCSRYPNTTDSLDDDIFKPIGLLQSYGSGANPMYFGLMTGGYNTNIANNGGKLRNHVGPVFGVGNFSNKDFVPAVNVLTGQVIDKGLIKNIDNLRISGRSLTHNPKSWEGAGYKNTFSWGNPLGEMLYEAVRYMSHAETPTYAFSNQVDTDISGSSILGLTAFNSGTRSWNKLRPVLSGSSCTKPVILLISDIMTDYDGDNVGKDLNLAPLFTAKAYALGANDLPQVYNTASYLDTISKLEHFDVTGELKYFYSTGPSDTCFPKTLPFGLKQVSGMCPNGASTMGTYSAAAVAYYAHIHDFSDPKNPNSSPTGVDIYTVTMSSAFPELTFPIRETDGHVRSSISILPVNITSKKANTVMGFLNYFVEEWEVDKNGLTFHALIKVNFSDIDKGDDWEGDGQVTYTIDLLTDGSTSRSKRETFSVKVDSGDPLLTRDKTYYKFKNPDNAKTKNDFITIKASEVRGLLVSSEWSVRGTYVGMAMGYTISGSTRDGTYFDLTMNTPPDSKFLTPQNCPYPGAPSKGPKGCGKKIVNLDRMSRVFAYSFQAKYSTSLPNPMYLAAKYGGFDDHNLNGIPDAGEWEGSDGNPKNYFQASNLVELPIKLEEAFRNISRSVNSNSALSLSLDTFMGGGIAVHTVFYPEYYNPVKNNEHVRWVGSVFGLFVDKWGNLREDSDGDRLLTVANTLKGDVGDSVLTFSSVKHPPVSPPNCYSKGNFISRCFDPYGNNRLSLFKDKRAYPPNIHQIKPLFDTGRWLAELDTTKLLSGSRPFSSPATISRGQRRIYFGNPTPTVQDPNKASLVLFDTSPTSLPLLNKLLLHNNYWSILPGAGTKEQTTKRLVEWIIGADFQSWRSRVIGSPWTDNKTPITWRLGDIINSKPILLGPPASNFDLLYGDLSYTAFKDSVKGRRDMLYFGANDGMLHAINLGFRSSFATREIRIEEETPGKIPHELGAEIWAYIPTSLIPQLQFLPDPSYLHSYYVDGKPLIVDAKVNGKWRTLLIGTLRLGGRPIIGTDPKTTSHYYSEVFCLDITDPEKEPILLWRYSHPKLGLPVGLPAVISVKGKFYAILPSGPTTDKAKAGPDIEYGKNPPYAGYSNQKARLIVIDLDTGQEVPEGVKNPEGFLVASETNSFFNNPFVPLAQIQETPWTNHAVYFGLTVSRNLATGKDSGALYRLKTVNSKGEPLPVSQWKLTRFFNTDRPVTGAVNATKDTAGNVWVVFATGRLWEYGDLIPCEITGTQACKENHDNYLYGIKEELKDGLMTFSDRTADATKLIDLSGVTVSQNQGISKLPKQSYLPAQKINNYGTLKSTLINSSAIGYKRKLNIGSVLDPKSSHSYEMVLTQPKIIGLGGGKSILSFTSFEPKSASCGDYGQGYMYFLDTYTGLPAPELASHFTPPSALPAHLKSDVAVGAISLGSGNPTEAFVVMGAAGLTISATGSDSSFHSVFLPLELVPKSQISNWREVLDFGAITKDVMSSGLIED